METISDESLQLAKLCDVCTYLVDRIDDSINQAKSASWTVRRIGLSILLPIPPRLGCLQQEVAALFVSVSSTP